MDLGGPQLHERGGGIHLDGAVRSVAADRRLAAEAVAVGDDDADAVNAVAGEFDFGGLRLSASSPRRCQVCPWSGVM